MLIEFVDSVEFSVVRVCIKIYRTTMCRVGLSAQCFSVFSKCVDLFSNFSIISA